VNFPLGGVFGTTPHRMGVFDGMVAARQCIACEQGAGVVPRSARSFKQEADALRAQGWTYRQIAADWVRRYGVNSRVAFRLAHGLTQADVALRWNDEWPDEESPKTAKHISYWEAWPAPSGRTPSLDTLNKLAFLYECAAGDLLDGEDHSDRDRATPTVVEPDRCTNESEGGTSAAHGPVTGDRDDPDGIVRAGTLTGGILVTDQLVGDFEALTDTYRRMDYRAGAPSVARDTHNHLRRMMSLNDRTLSRSVERRLFTAIGDAAQLAGWFAIDAQRYDLARSHCQLALNAAQRAGNQSLHAYVLGEMSYIHLHAGEGDKALRVLATATEISARGVPPAVRSWIAEATGEAHAFRGDARAGMAALHRAETAFDGVGVANTPVWLSFFNDNSHAARLKGRCLMRHHQLRQAEQALLEALDLLPTTFVRERSGTLIDLAFVHVQQREIEQACQVASEAETMARRTQSGRNQRRLRELLVELMPWTQLASVHDLYRQLLLN